MGGSVEDTFTEIVTLGSATTETYNKDETEEANQSIEASNEAKKLTYEEALKEEKFNTELRERMQTGGYRSLIGGAEVLDTIATGDFISEVDAPTYENLIEYDSWGSTMEDAGLTDIQFEEDPNAAPTTA